MMKLMSRAALAAFVLSLAGAAPGLAHGHKDYEGEGKGATRKAALDYAIIMWKHDVLFDTGHWPRWSTATKKEIECEREHDGMIECEVEAVPGH